MFTGIVEEVGRVRVVGERLFIGAARVVEGTHPGDSINVNGACLTVTTVEQDGFGVEVMPETRRRTNLGRLRPGQGVNLERALPLGGRLGGHLVQGHIDDTGTILAILPEERAFVVRFSAPSHLMPYIVAMGFIAVDGVSLTVIDCDKGSFTVSLVAYTRERTNFRERQVGDVVNLEVDIIAKYVERLQQGRGITQEQLSAFLSA